MANVIYGSEIAKQVKKDLRLRIMKLKNEQKRLPKLVVVLVGEHPASVSYVKGKEKACHEIGMEMISFYCRLPQVKMNCYRSFIS